MEKVGTYRYVVRREGDGQSSVMYVYVGSGDVPSPAVEMCRRRQSDKYALTRRDVCSTAAVLE